LHATWSRVGHPPEVPVTGERKSVKILGGLVRMGNSVQAYSSANGTSWNALGGALAGTVYVGLAVCAHNSAVLSTATFDNVTH